MKIPLENLCDPERANVEAARRKLRAIAADERALFNGTALLIFGMNVRSPHTHSCQKPAIFRILMSLSKEGCDEGCLQALGFHHA
jgi:hypothetical protein